jgi:hypothetical protein
MTFPLPDLATLFYRTVHSIAFFDVESLVKSGQYRERTIGAKLAWGVRVHRESLLGLALPDIVSPHIRPREIEPLFWRKSINILRAAVLLHEASKADCAKLHTTAQERDGSKVVAYEI